MKIKTSLKSIWIVTILSLALLVFGITQCEAQNERFTIGILSGLPDANTHNDTYDYGFNIGAHIELQEPIFYLRAKTYYLPSVNDLPYFDFDGGIGFNWRSRNDVIRLYSGGFTGLINRRGAWYPKFGLEIGLDVYVYNGFYLGIVADTQYKHDDKIWRITESGHNVKSINAVVGYSWYFKKQ